MENLGLKFFDNYISENEEQLIISDIENFRQNNPKLVANYGDNNYDSIYFGDRYKKNINDAPSSIVNIYNRLITDNLIAEIPFGIAINKYKKGQKIAAHIDKPISGPIVSILSLGYSSTMVFKKKNSDDIVQELYPKSLVQMKDEIRNEWTHEILPVKNLRYSIVFRSLQ
jgi:alkylated DNA repair dioxygenase AlkB